MYLLGKAFSNDNILDFLDFLGHVAHTQKTSLESHIIRKR